MSYLDLFDIGYNVLEKFHSDDSVPITNKYNWELYVLKKNDTNTTIYSKKLLDLLKEILKNRILLVDEFRKLDFIQKYLCYQNKYLSDNEIRIGNEYSKWKYSTNIFLLIDSNII